MMKILLLTIMLIFAIPASAGLYKWTDDDGNVHYSQKPPLNQEYKRLKAPPTPENNQPLYQSSSKSRKDPRKISKAETEKNLIIRAQNCEKSKKKLQVYQIYRRVRDKDGNVKTLGDTERANNIENAKKSIAEFCN